MRKVTVALALLAPFVGFAAVPANTVFEFRTGTSINTAGGGFVSGGAGTDMSQFDNPNSGGCSNCQSNTNNLSVADVNTNGTTTITSTTAAFTSAIVDNIIHLTGTGATTGRYHVVSFTNSTTVVLDRSPGTGGTTVSMTIGGAIGSSGNDLDALEVASPNGIQPGNVVYVKAGTWNLTATNTFNQVGTGPLPITYIGYASTRTDGQQVTVTRTSGTTVTGFSVTGSFHKFLNFHYDANAASGTHTGFGTATGTNFTFSNCRASNFTIHGFNLVSSNTILLNSWATGGIGGCTAGITVSGSSATALALLGNRSSANACDGFTNTGTSSGRIAYAHNIADGNTGHGFSFTNTTQAGMVNNVAHNNGGNGIFCDTTTTATACEGSIFANNILWSNGAFGLNSNATDYSAANLVIIANAFGDNTSGARNNFAVGPGDVTLTGDPFVNSGGGNFALNNTAGAGAAAKGVGFPGTLQSGGTGFLDIGALQSAGGGGGGGQKAYTWVK